MGGEEEVMVVGVGGGGSRRRMTESGRVEKMCCECATTNKGVEVLPTGVQGCRLVLRVSGWHPQTTTRGTISPCSL